MALYANLRDYKFSEEVDDIRGSDIRSSANGEKLGTIDDAIFDRNSGDMRYLVVDTGGWLRSNKFLVPAREVMTSTEGADRGYYVALTRVQIEKFPEYEEKVLEREKDFLDYERDYEEAYKLGSEGGVLHREGTTHMITPTAEELPPAGGRAHHHMGELRRIAHDMPRFGAASDSENVSNMPNVGFESRPLQPSSTMRPGDVSRDTGFTRGVESNEEIRREADRESEESRELGGTSEPAMMNRSEFLKDGTLRSEYDVAPEAEISGNAPDGGERFRKFQARLRHEREDILRRRGRGVRDVA
jgi:sporulation protein YlmC with PRC-barrel domain